MTLASIVSAPPSGRGTAIIIDHQQYAQAVILRGKPIPWADPTAYSQFLGQAQGLLKPDATLLDLGALYDNAVATNDVLKSSLSARSRTGYALKTLLADEKTGRAALELASVICQTSAAPLVLQIPSPMLWLALTHQLSGAGTMAASPSTTRKTRRCTSPTGCGDCRRCQCRYCSSTNAGRGRANCRW